MPINPNNPEPNSHTAGGIGTVLTEQSPVPLMFGEPGVKQPDAKSAKLLSVSTPFGILAKLMATEVESTTVVATPSV